MAKFTDYPAPDALDGTEQIMIGQGGETKTSTIEDIVTYADISFVKDEDLTLAMTTIDNLGDVNVTGIGVAEDGYSLTWDFATGKWVPADATISVLTDIGDVNVTTGAGIDGYSLTWDNATSKWIAVLASGNPFDQDLNTTDSPTFAGIINLSKTGTTGTGNVSLGVDAGNATMTGWNNITIGDTAGISLTDAVNNVIIGVSAGYSQLGGDNNVFIGNSAGYGSGLGTAYENVAVGMNSGNALSTGRANTLVGRDTGSQLTTGDFNVAMGYNAGYELVGGGSNAFIGDSAGDNVTTAFYSVAVGYRTGRYNLNGESNVLIGNSAGHGVNATSDNSHNVNIGSYSGYFHETGDANVFIGNLAGYQDVDGSTNIGIGQNAGYYQNAGWGNVSIGEDAGKGTSNANSHYRNVSIGSSAGLSLGNGGDNNVFVGNSAGGSVTSGDSNTFVGDGAGQNITTGFSNVAIGDTALGFDAAVNEYCVAIGYRAGAQNLGDNNVFIGRQAGYGDSTISGTASNNVYIGYDAGELIDNGADNVAIGLRAGQFSVSTSGATAVGFQAGRAGGDYNTSVGIAAGELATGANNTFIGRNAGFTLTTGSKNICIGYAANTSAIDATNQCIIGGTGADAVSVGIGTDNPTVALDIVGEIAVTSDYNQVGATGVTQFHNVETYNDTNSDYSYMQTWSRPNAITTDYDIYDGDLDDWTNLTFDATGTSIFWGMAQKHPDTGLYQYLVNLDPMTNDKTDEGYYNFRTPAFDSATASKIFTIRNYDTPVMQVTGGATGSSILTMDGDVDITGAFKINGTALGGADFLAVDSNIVATGADNTYDLGTATDQFKDLHLAGAVYKSGTELTPVVASATAPTDTSVFWIDTSV